MRTALVTLVALGWGLTGCTVAYHTQYVGETPEDVPESTVMSEATGKDVVVSYRNGEVVKGEMQSATADSLNLQTETGVTAFPRSGIAELRAGGSLGGSIVGCLVGMTGGALIGGGLGWVMAGGETHRWSEVYDRMGGMVVGVGIGAIGGGIAGILVGRKMTSGDIYVWPVKK